MLGPFQKNCNLDKFLNILVNTFQNSNDYKYFLLDVLKLCLRKDTARNKDDVRHLIPMFIGTPCRV